MTKPSRYAPLATFAVVLACVAITSAGSNQAPAQEPLATFAVGANTTAGSNGAPSQAPKPLTQVPQPGVPEIVTIEGKFVRAAYNNEGYVILGYQATNRSVGEPWILLEIGIALRDNVPDYKITRAAISLETPDKKTIPLPTAPEQRAGNTQAIQQRASVQRDSINYFPPNASRACALLFFPELGARALPYEETELSDDRACVGRLYFPVPGGITYGQHFLNVKFQSSLVRVPFRILTKEEEQLVDKNYKDIEKQIEDAFRPAKK